MKTTRHNAIAKCNCGSFLYSSGGGRFQYCACGKSFIDQERFMGLYVRLGGPCELVEQICPASCECREEHKTNKVIEDFDELKNYLQTIYGIEIESYHQSPDSVSAAI